MLLTDIDGTKCVVNLFSPNFLAAVRCGKDSDQTNVVFKRGGSGSEANGLGVWCVYVKETPEEIQEKMVSDRAERRVG